MKSAGREGQGMNGKNSILAPVPGDYFEGYYEAQKINPKNNISWYETYVQDFNEWKSFDYDNRKDKSPRRLRELFPSSFL